MDAENKSLARIQPETPESPVTVELMPRGVQMYPVLNQELEALGSANVKASLHIGFFGAALSAAITCGVTLTTVTITSPFIYAAYWAALIVSAPATVYFLISSIVYMRSAKKEIRRIKEESQVRKDALAKRPLP
jgi:hypothetical protein